MKLSKHKNIKKSECAQVYPLTVIMGRLSKFTVGRTSCSGMEDLGARSYVITSTLQPHKGSQTSLALRLGLGLLPDHQRLLPEVCRSHRWRHQ